MIVPMNKAKIFTTKFNQKFELYEMFMWKIVEALDVQNILRY